MSLAARLLLAAALALPVASWAGSLMATVSDSVTVTSNADHLHPKQIEAAMSPFEIWPTNALVCRRNSGKLKKTWGLAGVANLRTRRMNPVKDSLARMSDLMIKPMFWFARETSYCVKNAETLYKATFFNIPRSSHGNQHTTSNSNETCLQMHSEHHADFASLGHDRVTSRCIFNEAKIVARSIADVPYSFFHKGSAPRSSRARIISTCFLCLQRTHVCKADNPEMSVALTSAPFSRAIISPTKQLLFIDSNKNSVASNFSCAFAFSAILDSKMLLYVSCSCMGPL